MIGTVGDCFIVGLKVKVGIRLLVRGVSVHSSDISRVASIPTCKHFNLTAISMLNNIIS